jgi:hypothetical protein
MLSPSEIQRVELLVAWKYQPVSFRQQGSGAAKLLGRGWRANPALYQRLTLLLRVLSSF